MFLQHKSTQDVIEILSLQDLFDPCLIEVTGQNHCGEELQEPERFLKSELIFPSGESLPRCWMDASYRRLPEMAIVAHV
ncbi:acetyltransferase [Leptolyngbya sp. 'hensonii']|uniref:acetyltransferase n=1 Tax=Leptolyngbya sp. 'hensonii' TaxID=1922337 RepID=UPI00094F8A90|nr:acetyltransferase [Leptolyngbya sp. 'hensonii']OLP19398.1 acetyltransferase [Leptolyngbya sp. 'hensonii']